MQAQARPLPQQQVFTFLQVCKFSRWRGAGALLRALFVLLFLQTCHKPATLHRAQWCVVVTTTELVLLHGDGLGVGGGEMSVVVGGSLRVAADSIFCARAGVVVGGSRACREPSRCVLKRLRWGGDFFDVRGA